MPLGIASGGQITLGTCHLFGFVGVILTQAKALESFYALTSRTVDMTRQHSKRLSVSCESRPIRASALRPSAANSGSRDLLCLNRRFGRAITELLIFS